MCSLSTVAITCRRWPFLFCLILNFEIIIYISSLVHFCLCWTCISQWCLLVNLHFPITSLWLRVVLVLLTWPSWFWALMVCKPSDYSDFACAHSVLCRRAFSCKTLLCPCSFLSFSETLSLIHGGREETFMPLVRIQEQIFIPYSIGGIPWLCLLLQSVLPPKEGILSLCYNFGPSAWSH